MSRFLNLGNIFSFRFDITTSGTPEQLSPKIAGAITISYTNNGAGTADTINDSGNGFLVAGFQPGMTVTVSGSTSNDDDYLITAVAAGTLTLDLNVILTTEIAGDTTTLTTDGVNIADGTTVIIKAS